MAVEGKRAYAQVTPLEKAATIGYALLLPGVILWNVCTWYLHAETWAKSLSQLINDSALNHVTKLDTPKLQYMLGTTDKVYRAWAKKSGVPIVEEEVGEDAKIYWLGPKRPEKVILYLHGGGFLLPMFDCAPPFWKYVQEQLGKKGLNNTGIAILQYTLIPTATIPTQLKQAVLAVQHLLSIGISPQNIQLSGDSAGANLIFQLISHVLHPVDGVPTLKLDAPLRGACLISPWVKIDDCHNYQSFKNPYDIIAETTAVRWGQEVLDSGIPDGYTPYIQPLKAPNTWFQDIPKAVDRIYITSGELDLLRDQGIEFKSMLERHHKDIKYVIQSNGVHDGPLLEFASSTPHVSQVTIDIVEWFASGF